MKYKDDINDAYKKIKERDNPYITHIDTHPSLCLGRSSDTYSAGDEDDEHIANFIKKRIDTMKKEKEKLRDDIRLKPKPFAIVWDIILDISKEAACYKIINAFKEEIRKGDIVFILIKSAQKYMNMGTGKAKTGFLTIIGNTRNVDVLNSLPKMDEMKRYSKDHYEKYKNFYQWTYFIADPRILKGQPHLEEAIYNECIKNAHGVMEKFQQCPQFASALDLKKHANFSL